MDRRYTFLTIIFLLVLVFVPRVLDLDAWRAPDEDRWIANTNGFTRDIAHGKFSTLVKLPHPGITVQWLGAVANQYDSWTIKRLPLTVGAGLLIVATGYVFGRLWGVGGGFTTVLALSTNPLLYAHSRIFAMDTLLALFIALSLGLLLLWHKEKATRYLVAAAFCAAAATLSKMSGIIVAPVTLLLLVWWQRDWKPPLIWIAAFIASCVVILPTFAINPAGVIGDMTELFRSGDYADHHLGTFYYLRTLIFFSTPTQWLGLLVALPLFVQWRRSQSRSLEHGMLLLGMAIAFAVAMSAGGKKGDRYILPTFVMLDLVSALGMSSAYQLWREGLRIKTHPTSLKFRGTLLLTALVWQCIIIWQTHPHTMAYINPLTQPFFGERRHGWGEGLDLAAQYLNQKPAASTIKVATYYPTEFGAHFMGEAVPAHQHDEESVEYVIIYRAMFERGSDAWETDVVKHYHNQRPEKIVTIGQTEMAWIYKR